MDPTNATRRSEHSPNPIETLADYSQGVWLDYIHRSLITSGELERLITQDGLRGITSNLAIIEKAIVGSSDYKIDLEKLRAGGTDPKTAYEQLAIRDVQEAADLLRPIYDSSSTRRFLRIGRARPPGDVPPHPLRHGERLG